jgi:nucleoid-associated protein YgaU
MMAKLKLKQKEREQLPTSAAGGSNPRGQNPTTVGLAGLASHVVRDGDTLQSIAFAHYRDPTRWRRIAEANGIDDPMRLRRGHALTIPADEG